MGGMSGLRLWQIALVVLLLAGCGSSGGGVSVDAGRSGTQPPQTGTLVVRQTVLARAVAAEIDSVRIFGYGNLRTDFDAYAPLDEIPIYGPKVLPKSSVYTLDDVPVSVKSLRLEYLQNGSVRGIYQQEVTISPDVDFEIVDPDYIDLAAAFTHIEIMGVSVKSPEAETERLTVFPQDAWTSYWVEVIGYADGGGQGINISHLVALTSDNPQIVSATRTVSGHHEVEYKQAGLAHLTATFLDLQDSIEVEVLYTDEPILRELTLLQSGGQLTVGDPTQLTAIGKFSDGQTRNVTSSLIWSEQLHSNESPLLSFDPNVSGLVTPLNPGTAWVWLEFPSQRFKAAGPIAIVPRPE